MSKIDVNYETVKSLPTTPFSEEKVLELWNNYIEKLQKQGKKSVASIMNANKPTVRDNHICIELSNNIMKSQLEQAKPLLLKYLQEKLDHYKMDILITVNEEKTKKYAYTPQEKYQKLKEKNAAIELLRKTFGLDL